MYNMVTSFEQELLASNGLHDGEQARLVDWEFLRVPSGDAGLVDIDAGDVDPRAVFGHHRHCGATDIAGAHTSDSHSLTRITHIELIDDWEGSGGAKAVMTSHSLSILNSEQS